MSENRDWFRWRLNLRRYGVAPAEIAACAAAGLALGVAMAAGHSPVAGAATAYLVSVMLLVTLIDARRKLIPDVLSLPSIAAGLAAAVALASDPGPTLLDHAGAAVLGGLGFLGMRTAYRHARGTEGLGLGDVKLAAAAGAWTGLADLPLTILLASMSALALVLIKRATGNVKASNPLSAIPFGSFLAPALMMVWIYGLYRA